MKRTVNFLQVLFLMASALFFQNCIAMEEQSEKKTKKEEDQFLCTVEYESEIDVESGLMVHRPWLIFSPNPGQFQPQGHSQQEKLAETSVKIEEIREFVKRLESFEQKNNERVTRLQTFDAEHIEGKHYSYPPLEDMDNGNYGNWGSLTHFMRSSDRQRNEGIQGANFKPAVAYRLVRLEDAVQVNSILEAHKCKEGAEEGNK